MKEGSERERGRDSEGGRDQRLRTNNQAHLKHKCLQFLGSGWGR